MIHLIITGHGSYAEGLYSAAQLLCGELAHSSVVNFYEGMSAETLEASLRDALTAAGEYPVLCLADILGGTPFRVCANIATQRVDCEVLSGANVQMLVEASLERDEARTVSELAQVLVTSAREGITTLSAQWPHKKKNISLNEDGI